MLDIDKMEEEIDEIKESVSAISRKDNSSKNSIAIKQLDAGHERKLSSNLITNPSAYKKYLDEYIDPQKEMKYEITIS